MARQIGASDLIDFGSAATIDDVPAPYSIAFWYKRTADTGGNKFFSKGTVNRFEDNSNTLPNQVDYVRQGNVGDVFGYTSTTFKVVDGWMHIAITVSSSLVPKIYKNGTECSYNNQNAGSGSFVSDAANSLTFDGSQQTGAIAEFGMWSSELSGANVATLAGGALATSVSSGTLLRRAALRGTTPEVETVTGLNLTLTGTTVVADPPTLAADVPPALASGTVTMGSLTSTGATATVSGTSGGTSPYNYQFQRAPDVAGSAGTYANVGSSQTGTSYTDSGLTASTSYWWRVVTTDSAGSPATVTSAGVKATTTAPAALASGTISVGSLTTTTANVTTTAATGGTGPYHYQFQRAPDVAGSAGTYANIGSSQLSTSYSDSGLTASTAYWWRVVTTDSAGSPATVTSTGVKATTAAALASGTVSVGSLTSATATITASGGTGGTAPYHYQFQRAPDSSGSAGTYASIGSSQLGTTYADSGLTAVTPYWWRVSVTDSAGTPATVNSAGVKATTTSGGISGLVVAVTLTNTSGSATPATTFLPMGHPFVKGEVAASSKVQCTWTPTSTGVESAALPVQVSGKVTWSDGSLKFIRLLVALPSIAGSGTGSLKIYAVAGSQATTIPGGKTTGQVATDLSTNFPTSVALVNVTKGSTPSADGTGTWSWWLATQIAFLGSTDSRSRVRCEVIESGPLCVTFHSWGPITAGATSGGADHPHLIVRAFHRCWLNSSTGAIDRVEYLHSLEQGWVEDLAGGSVAADLAIADVTVKLSGSAVSGRTWTGLHFPHHTCHALTAVDGTGTSGNVNTAGSDWTSGSPTLRAAISKSYWIRSTLAPPYDVDYFDANPLSPTDDASPQSYAPGARTCFLMSAGLNTGGEHEHHGLIPAWSVRALHSQAPGYIRTDLTQALFHGHIACRLRNPSTGRVPKLISDTAMSDASAGLGTSRHAVRYYARDIRSSDILLAAEGGSGVTGSEGGWSGVAFEMSHWPTQAYHSYLRTGAPWLLEFIKLDASQTLLPNGDGTSDFGRHTVLPDGTTLEGRWATLQYNGPRVEAWSWKTGIQCVAVLPDDAVERPYFLRNYTVNVAAAAQFLDPTRTAWNKFQALGVWAFPWASDGGNPKPTRFGGPWMQMYLFISRAWGHMVMEGDANSLAYINHHIKFLKAMCGADANQTCSWSSDCYSTWFGPPGNYPTADFWADWSQAPLYADDSDAAISASFSSSTGYVTAPVATLSGYPFANGDRVMFGGKDGDSTLSPPASVTPCVFYFIRDLDVPGGRYKISATSGGTALTFATSPSGISVAYRPTTCPVASATPGSLGARQYTGGDSTTGITQAQMCANLAIILGLASPGDAWPTNVNARLSTARTVNNWPVNGGDWNVHPQYKFAAALPVAPTGGALAAGTVSVGSLTTTTATATTTSPTGGTVPYHYQFQRAPDVAGSAGTYANIGSSQLGTSYSDSGLTAATSYWWRVVVTDSAGTPATVTATGVKATTTSGGGGGHGHRNSAGGGRTGSRGIGPAVSSF